MKCPACKSEEVKPRKDGGMSCQLPKVRCLCETMWMPDLVKVPVEKVAWKCLACGLQGPEAMTQDRAAIAWDEKFKNAQGKNGKV